MGPCLNKEPQYSKSNVLEKNFDHYSQNKKKIENSMNLHGSYTNNLSTNEPSPLQPPLGIFQHPQIKLQRKQSFGSDLQIPVAQNTKVTWQINTSNSYLIDSIYQKQQKQKQNPLSNSVDDLDIPISSTIQNSTNLLDSQIQNKQQEILSSSYLTLQQYKNFSLKERTNGQGQLLSSNPFSCFANLVFELLCFNSQKLQSIKNDILRIPNFVSNMNFDQEQDYGNVTEPDHIKKIFLEYLVKILGHQSAISILQKYSIMQSILQPIVISYIIYKNKDREEEIKQKYNKRIFDQQFTNLISNNLGVELKREQNVYIFEQRSAKLRIELIENEKCKGKIIQ